jgi:non-heme chloroperoxidase
MRAHAAARNRELAHAGPALAQGAAMNFRILRAVLAKDVRSLLPLVTLTALLSLGDALIVRLDLLPIWSTWGSTVLMVAYTVFVITVFQLDSAASFTEDWLCRPVRKRDLLGSKFLLVVAAIYLPHAVGTFIADVALGYSLWESLLDAMLVPDRLFLFFLPILMFVAIVTRTFVQGFGVLFAIFVCVFVIPTPFVRAPGPLDLGIRDALLVSGMLWLATLPARLTTLAFLVLGFWLVYWRRNLPLARAVLVITVLVAVSLFVLPMSLIPWQTTFGLQAASAAAPPPEAARVSLRSTQACFPATLRSQISSDAAFVAAKEGLYLWSDEELGDAGRDAIAFITAAEARGLPLDWRVKLNYVQANYSANGVPVESLRPASFMTDWGDGPLMHAWMLPESTLARLKSVQPQLELKYSLTLLKPRNHFVPTDGKRHALPGLGWCSAKPDVPRNLVEVECFSAISHPTQISAQLNDVAATRRYGPVDFAPGWARQLYGDRVELTLGWLRIAKHDTITVTAWENAGAIEKSLALPGILGNDTETCPLPTKGGNRFQQTHWRDSAPHEPSSVTVDDGVQLEVLDFGGTGSPVLLLPGLGATAHSFDELAPQLARQHRVIAMTRRGNGGSSRTDFGFDTPRLSQDVLKVMDAMRLDKVLLVGHSVAGDELTWLGGHHPERIAGLVYLDAAYDRSADRNDPTQVRLRELGRFEPPEPAIPPAALVNFEAMTRLLLERGHVRLPEGELIAFLQVDRPYLAGTPTIDGLTQQAILAAIEKPDYSRVKIPALAIYAFAKPGTPLPPWYDTNDRELMSSLAERARIRDALKRENIDLFKRNVEKGQVLELPNSAHYVFQSNPAEVLEAIERFASNLESPDRRSEAASTVR